MRRMRRGRSPRGSRRRSWNHSAPGNTAAPAAGGARANRVAARAVAEGFTAVKLNPFRAEELGERDGVERAVERVRAVRAAIGPAIDLLVDCVGALDFPAARRAARLLEPLDLFWLEEPFPLD